MSSVQRPYSAHPLYKTWEGMHRRCENPKHQHYKDYGARGINVCSRWDSFPNFVQDVGERPFPGATLDRKNPNGNYEPGNVRWASRSVQQRNQRQRTGYKLNPEKVSRIRALAEAGTPCARLATVYGVSHVLIVRIVNRKVWKKVS